jgi:hypothetical protein
MRLIPQQPSLSDTCRGKRSMTGHHSARFRAEEAVSMTSVPTPITTVIDGIEVRGVITAWCISDISVEITHPFGGLCTGVHMMAQALGFQNYLGDSGLLRAKGLLHELYALGRKVAQRAPALRDGLATYDNQCADIDARRRAIQTERISVKAAFRSGEITQSVYQGTRKRLENETFELDARQRALQDEHLFSRLPADIPIADRERLIACIRSVAASRRA